MAGLLNAARSAPAQGAQVQTGNAQPREAQPKNADSGSAGDDEGSVSAEEQSQYNEFVANGMRLMNDEKGLEAMLQSIQGDGNPVEGLANTVASIVIRVEDSAQQQGVEVSGDVLMHGGTELLEQAADMAEQVGMHEFSDEDLETALYMAMDIYRTTRQQQGKLPQEQFGQEMAELQAAEQDGSLEKLIPGITEHSQRPQLQGGNVQPSAGNAQPSRGLLR